MGKTLFRSVIRASSEMVFVTHIHICISLWLCFICILVLPPHFVSLSIFPFFFLSLCCIHRQFSNLQTKARFTSVQCCEYYRTNSALIIICRLMSQAHQKQTHTKLKNSTENRKILKKTNWKTVRKSCANVSERKKGHDFSIDIKCVFDFIVISISSYRATIP